LSGYELGTVHTDAVIVYKFLKDLSNGTGGSENLNLPEVSKDATLQHGNC